MATNIPPHNMREVVKAVELLVDNPEATIGELRKAIKGPDFPTGAYIYGRQGIKEAYETGRGRVIMRARAQIEEKETSGRSQIVVTEIPYQVNKENLVKAIAELASEKKIEGIVNINDESDKEVMRIVIALKRDHPQRRAESVVQAHPDADHLRGDHAGAHERRPQGHESEELLQHFIDHRPQGHRPRTPVRSLTPPGAEHILDGLKIAVDTSTRSSRSSGSRRTRRGRCQLSEAVRLQREAERRVLNMRLANSPPRDRKLDAELKEVRATIKDLKSILASKPKRMAILKEEMEEVSQTFGDDRRTEIVADQGEFTVEDLIAEEDMVITVSHGGYIKRIPITTYKRQRRGGRGLNGADLRADDWVEHLFIASTHDYLMFFSNRGQVYWLKVPRSRSRTGRRGNPWSTASP